MTLRVLLVEDESLVAMLVEDMLSELGFEVVGIASRLAAAMEMAETVDCDVAVLDVNLGGGVSSFPVAETLRRRGIPCLFATGFSSAGIRLQGLDAPVLQKPFCREDLERGLGTAMATGPGQARGPRRDRQNGSDHHL